MSTALNIFYTNTNYFQKKKKKRIYVKGYFLLFTILLNYQSHVNRSLESYKTLENLLSF